jgi:hypothetical protein
MSNIIEALRSFILSRPGFDPHNYSSSASYRADQRTAARDKADALTMLTVVERYPNTEPLLANACQRAFSGRLSWYGERLDYCPGQYYPTEYRAAACAVLASALWDAWRTEFPDATAADIRARAARTFRRGIASRWFR